MATTIDREVCTWTSSATGKPYAFTVHGLWESLSSIPCVYIYAIRDRGVWVPLYTGETNNLARRVKEHRNDPWFSGARATHIHVHWESNALLRIMTEGELGGR